MWSRITCTSAAEHYRCAFYSSSLFINGWNGCANLGCKGARCEETPDRWVLRVEIQSEACKTSSYVKHLFAHEFPGPHFRQQSDLQIWTLVVVLTGCMCWAILGKLAVFSRASSTSCFRREQSCPLWAPTSQLPLGTKVWVLRHR